MLSIITVAGAVLALAFVWHRYWREDTVAAGSGFRTGRAKRDTTATILDGHDTGAKTKAPQFGRRSSRNVGR